MRKRGELDSIPALCEFAGNLENACKDVMNAGKLTKDLVLLTDDPTAVTALNTRDFISEIRLALEKKYN